MNMGRLISNLMLKLYFFCKRNRRLDISNKFGKLLRDLRKQKGLTQEQLAFDAGIRRTYVSILELGQQQPSLTTVIKLSNALSISTSQLLALLENE